MSTEEKQEERAAEHQRRALAQLAAVRIVFTVFA
jgi:hypothetical protein